MARAETPVVTAADVLERAAALVRQGWTRGWYARDEYDAEVGAAEATACKWCLVGAISRARTELGATSETVDQCLDHLRAMLDYGPLGTWNDGQWDAAPVVSVLEKAARMLKEDADARP